MTIATTGTGRRGIATAAAVVLLAMTGAACAGGSSGDSAEPSSADAPNGANGGGADGGAEFEAAPDAAKRDAAVNDTDSVLSTALNGGPEESTKEQSPVDPKVISTGNVAMKSDDVGQSIFDVGKVVDRYRGQVDQETTETDDDGDALRSRMVIRVPADTFTDAMEDLEEVAVLISSSANSKDVTTTVLDKQARIQVQRRSIQRIQVLLDRAVTVRDIINIEAELSRRIADLAALERQARYLADQTSMSTISVSIERPRKPATPPEEEKDETGFFAGLSAGWDALTKFTVGLTTVLGALLPWLIVLAVLGLIGLPLLRRLRRNDTTPAAPTEAPA